MRFSTNSLHICMFMDCKDCPVYEGHFPSYAVAPGAFNMQLVMECAERIVNYTLKVKTISRCRLFLPILPKVVENLYVVVYLTMKADGYDCYALIEDANYKYMEYKGHWPKGKVKLSKVHMEVKRPEEVFLFIT